MHALFLVVSCLAWFSSKREFSTERLKRDDSSETTVGGVKQLLDDIEILLQWPESVFPGVLLHRVLFCYESKRFVRSPGIQGRKSQIYMYTVYTV